jgi:hypothetical protein
MGTSGNPAKRASTTKKTASVSSIKDFKKRKQGVELTLPSGLIIKARRAELRSFLATGDVPNPLIPMIEEAINKGRNVDVNEITGLNDGEFNLDTVNDMYEMVDNVVMTSCVEPQVHPVPEDEDEDRDDDLLYIDEFEDEDKMFVFQWCIGGTDDIAQFRAEAEEGLVSLAQGQGNRSTAK